MRELTAGLKRRISNSLGRTPGQTLPFLAEVIGGVRGKPSARLLAYVTFATVALLVVFNSLYVVMGGTNGIRFVEDALVLKKKAVHHISLDCGAKCDPRRLLILQTSDGESGYSKMLDVTQEVQLAYALHWKYSYLRWDGIARGNQAWMATYNRIYLLYELYKQKKYHWVLFLDPDAVFKDVNEGIDFILDDKYAVIGCRGGEDPNMWWDINIGVAFFNLQHPDFGDIIAKWHWRITWTPFYKLHKSNSEQYVQMRGGPPVMDDQQMFHHFMKTHPKGSQLIKRYFGEESHLFNYVEGNIITHLIRADNKNQDLRLQTMQGLRDKFFETVGRLTVTTTTTTSATTAGTTSDGPLSSPPSSSSSSSPRGAEAEGAVLEERGGGRL